MSREKKKILILTADVGFGHRSAANAIAAALEQLEPDNIDVLIENPLNHQQAPAILRESQTDYDDLVRKMPDVYKLQYEFSDAPVPNAIITQALTVMLYNVIYNLLKRTKPDAVVSTHPFFPAPSGVVTALSQDQIPLITAVTDLTMVHRQWFHESTDLHLLPTQETYEQAFKLGIPEKQLIITGIPVHPDFSNIKLDKQKLRENFGWIPDPITLLVVASRRVKNIKEVLHVINHSGFPLQLILVAGGDEELYQYLSEIEWHLPVRLYNFVERIPEFMHAADMIMSKAGGLIVTEALASGLPMMLVDVTPGQEEGNAGFVIQHGAAERIRNPIDILETICHWLGDGNAILNRRANNAAGLGKPDAALHAAKEILKLSRSGRNIPTKHTGVNIQMVREVLARFGLSNEAEDQADMRFLPGRDQ